MPDPVPATRPHRKTLPLPEATSTIRVGLELTEDDLRRISLGYIPRDMDEKWFIFREGSLLYFHRSWTGVCVYAATIDQRGSGAVITEAKVNRDPKQHKARMTTTHC